MNCGLEICIDTLESAKNAIRGGADQLEVCSSLALGGLTPTVGLVRAIRSFDGTIPLMCMIRSRHGDFVNTEDELEVLLLDIAALREAGATGFVFGCLDSANKLDLADCGRLLLAASPLSCTLHRAFDLAQNWKQCLQDAAQLGFSSILTSGQENTATLGLECLKEVVDMSKNRIRILVGSGVNSNTLPLLLSTLGTNCWYHASASVPANQRPERHKIETIRWETREADSALAKLTKTRIAPLRIPMGPADNLGPRKTSQEETRSMKDIIQAFRESL